MHEVTVLYHLQTCVMPQVKFACSHACLRLSASIRCVRQCIQPGCRQSETCMTACKLDLRHHIFLQMVQYSHFMQAPHEQSFVLLESCLAEQTTWHSGCSSRHSSHMPSLCKKQQLLSKTIQNTTLHDSQHIDSVKSLLRQGQYGAL